ncbi:hypothetical protein K435DRAFT_789167 [Dendrothele bispora CBS 962.96]|uniref:Uncharacterized protein n=1 Tax=Dendrothele bispora (strain CBS 962.96) TaxID=1314807 RepID=A0A4S8MTY3_DENBC|nr:hypothetical protein K435DRAFT_789167 [Dendrothele bispora CBS 962.96]
MSFNDLPFLTFFHNTSFRVDGIPVERDIDRSRLIEVSPDREDTFAKGLSIHELRQLFKINSVLVNEEWLSLHKIQHDVKIRKTTMRTSAFFRDARENQREQGEKEKGTDENTGRAGRAHSRRISSGSSFNPVQAMSSIENRLLTNVHEAMRAGGIPLPYVTTHHKMISPRPLGPTHVLVAVEASQEEKAGNVKQRNRGDYIATYSTCLELPINDLLFILGCPNLNEAIGDTTHWSPLPHRLTDELPRVGVRVPNLQTFPELVIFLHTYNQAELLRKIIPQWVRDMVHPLTILSGFESHQNSAASKSVTRGSISSLGSQDSVSSKRDWFATLFGRGRTPSSGSVSLQSSSSSLSVSGPNSLGSQQSSLPGPLGALIDAHTSSAGLSQATRTLHAVARDIAYSANRAAIADTNKESIDLVQMQMSLNALRENLDFVGYFEKSLWNELDIYREVLLKAISFQAELTRD